MNYNVHFLFGSSFKNLDKIYTMGKSKYSPGKDSEMLGIHAKIFMNNCKIS